LKHVFLISNGEEDVFNAEKYFGEELIILIVLDSRGMAAGEADKRIEALLKKANSLSLSLAPRAVSNRVVIQWGNPYDELQRCLEREEAVQLL